MRYLFILLLCSSASFADYFTKKNFEFAIGATGKSLLYKRGIITYQGYQVVPLVSIVLFNPNLILAGKSLYHKYAFNKNFHIRSRLHFDSTEDHPAYFSDEKKEQRIRREKTNEVLVYFQYDFRPSTYLRFNIAKDIKAHKGQYYELKGRYDFLDFSKEKKMVNIGLFTAIGYANHLHNRYLYGANTKGFNNIEYGISMTSPKAIDNFWPVVKLTRFELLNRNIRKGSFVQERDGVSIELLMAKRIY
ncbi:MAG: hypothetical protein N4A33_05150 [Bacteriovoracaceae bacterium]|jgi:hypothetical protein|nr:hypothetical protein [Bacteriovoracaceae bacterium]